MHKKTSEFRPRRAPAQDQDEADITGGGDLHNWQCFTFFFREQKKKKKCFNDHQSTNMCLLGVPLVLFSLLVHNETNEGLTFGSIRAAVF